MPEPTEVAIFKRDGSIFGVYTTYGEARENAESGDLIQIRADLNEQQIVLLDGVDIWILPGVVVSNSSDDTITDFDVNSSKEVHCKIYGEGIIKNTGGYSCVFLDNINSELKVECDSFDTSTGNSDTIKIVRAKKFHLLCNTILSKGTAINIAFDSQVVVEDINLNISRVETGDTSTSPIVGTSIITYANGFIKIDELICKNRGHALLHKNGSVFARIKKISTTRISGNIVSTVSSDGAGNDAKKLILYFDEILCIGSYDGIEHARGTGIFIGRRVYSSGAHALEIVGANTKGYVKCNELIHENTDSSASSVVVNDNIEEITIDSNYIAGNSPQVVYSAGGSTNPANFVIKNAKIKNTNSSSSSKGILIANVFPKLTLNNVKIIAGTENGNIIALGSGTSLDVKNYGLFGNVSPGTNVNLKIGPKPGASGYNYQCIFDPDLN